MDEYTSDEEQFRNVKRPSTGLAEKYKQKQLKEAAVLANVLTEQAKKFDKVVTKADGSLQIIPCHQILEAELPPITFKPKVLQPIQETKKTLEQLTLNEAIDLAINENWKDNIDNLSPGKQDTIKKLLSLADSIRGNRPFVPPATVAPAVINISNQLYEEQTKSYSLKEAMAIIHNLQLEQKEQFDVLKEDVIEHWSDTIAEALIENKKHITATNSGKIIKVD